MNKSPENFPEFLGNKKQLFLERGKVGEGDLVLIKTKKSEYKCTCVNNDSPNQFVVTGGYFEKHFGKPVMARIDGTMAPDESIKVAPIKHEIPHVIIEGGELKITFQNPETKKLEEIRTSKVLDVNLFKKER